MWGLVSRVSELDADNSWNEREKGSVNVQDCSAFIFLTSPIILSIKVSKSFKIRAVPEYYLILAYNEDVWRWENPCCCGWNLTLLHAPQSLKHKISEEQRTEVPSISWWWCLLVATVLMGHKIPKWASCFFGISEMCFHKGMLNRLRDRFHSGKINHGQFRADWMSLLTPFTEKSCNQSSTFWRTLHAKRDFALVSTSRYFDTISNNVELLEATWQYNMNRQKVKKI